MGRVCVALQAPGKVYPRVALNDARQMGIAMEIFAAGKEEFVWSESESELSDIPEDEPSSPAADELMNVGSMPDISFLGAEVPWDLHFNVDRVTFANSMYIEDYMS